MCTYRVTLEGGGRPPTADYVVIGPQFNGVGGRWALYWILQGSQVAKLPFLKLRKVLWSSDIKVQDILEVEKLLLLREMEELGTQYLNLESETPFNDL
ncbi:hypothetical protein N7522_006360 [Penicillium canescens]|uniref:Uncharacterized protein n=1 Tax=Penicillium canescens TaxID=5083 RepID=A0AAD6IBF5_PENCN|nr:uncharacterized protein N7446_010690 [Penicillium canescens]KAJ6003668.1 hypothetical protein N7522_006360 [Penicillium canescens]KAJ6041420.1 hypothetical protein N7460_006810 [Penicillium canescens]KAJ6050581.1 hypothetical protein N7446_010690 [Penicillium canescens]KAJ6065800.1 hypothetical protein N7444_001453 [Penicillium canescens]